MKVSVQTPSGSVLELEQPGDPNETTIARLKILITSSDASLGSELRLWYEGNELTNDEATLKTILYWEGTRLILSTDGSVPAMGGEPDVGITMVGGRGGSQRAGLPLQGREGDVPMAGFAAVQIVVVGASNERTNGLYIPAPPHGGKLVWYKAPSTEEFVEGESKDRGERGIYYSAKQEKWFIGDELEAGGFAYSVAWGNCAIPHAVGWSGGASLEFKAEVADGDLNTAAALTELTKLCEVERPDQETCYATMVKVLGNIASNPGEAKFCAIKIDNAAIQNKILKHNGARGFLEAIGFREGDGALRLPQDRHSQAAEARDLLHGFAIEASYRAVRKERHAKAAEEIKIQAKKDALKRPAAKREDAGGGGAGGGGSRFGKDRGTGG